MKIVELILIPIAKVKKFGCLRPEDEEKTWCEVHIKPSSDFIEHEPPDIW